MPKQSLSVQSSVWSGPLNWERWLMTQPAIRGPGAAGLGAGIAKKAASTALASSALQQLDQQLRERYDAMRQALLSRALADGLPAPLVDQWMGSLNRAFASRRDQLHYLANRYGLPEASSGPPGAAASAAPTSAMVSAAGQLRSVLRQLRQGQASYERAMASLQESAGGGTGERIREVRAALASLRAQKAELDSSLAGMKSLSELANIQYDPEILDSMLGISDPYARTGNWLAKFFSNVADIWGGSEAKNRRRAALYQEHRSQARAAEMRKQLQEQETLLMSELQDLEARAAQLTQTQRAALTRQWEQSKSKLEARRAELLAAHPELEELARLDEAHASAVEGLRENPFDPELQREVQQLTQALSKFTAPSTTLAAASPGSSGGQQGVSLPELLVASPLSLASGHGFDRSAHGWDDRNFRRGGSRYWIVYDDQPRGWKRRYREMAREERGADPETLQRHQEELKMRGGARRPSAAPVAASETPPGPWAAEDLEPEQLPVAPTPMPAVEPAKLDLGPGSGGLGPLHKASLHRSLILPGLAAAAVLSAGRRQQPAAPAPSAQIIPLPPATGDDLSRLEVLATMAAARSASRKRRRRRPSRSDTAARPRDPSEESTDLQADLQADL